MNAIIPVYRDTLQNYFGIGDNIFGFMLSMVSVGFLSVLVGGAYSDRHGPRKVIRICFLGIAVAFAGLTFAGSNWIFVAAALALHGFFFHPLAVAVNSYLIRLFPNNKRRALSLNMAGSSVGAMFLPSMAEGLLGLSKRATAVSFAAIFHIPFAVAGAFLLAGSFLYGKKKRFGREEGRKRFNLRDMGVKPRFLPVIFFMLMHGMADSAIHIWLPRYLGSGIFESVVIGPGYVISGHAVAYIVSRTLLGFLPEGIGRRVFLILPGILGGSLFIMGLLSGNYLMTAFSYILGAFLWSAEFPAMLGLLGHEIPDKVGAALGLHALLSSASLFFVHNGMGLIFARLPVESLWRAMIIPAAFFPCVGIGCAIWLLKYGKDLKTV